MKRLVYFLKNYRLLSWIIAGLISGLVLELFHLTIAVHWEISIISLITVIPLLWGMWLSIRAGNYGIDLPGIVAIVAAVILRQYWVSIAVALILVINLSLKNVIVRRVQRRKAQQMDKIPDLVHVFRKRRLVDVQIGDIHVGDEIEIRPGEVIPVDAVIKNGTGNFDESSLTGSHKLQYRQGGDIILGGSTNVNETINAKVLRTTADNQYRQIARFERSAMGSPAPINQRVDFYSIYFMLGAYIIAIAAWFVSRQSLRFLEVIVIASPAPIILVPTFSLITGLQQAAKRGIVIKTASLFEQLAKAKTYAFDKTTILADQAAEIESVTVLKPATQRQVLRLTGSLTQRSNHPLAQAISQAVVSKRLKFIKTKHIQQLSGFGAEAHIGNQDVLLGHFGLMQERGISLPQHFKPSPAKQTTIYVAADHKLIGYLTFKDSYRSDVQPMLKKLTQLGVVRTLVVTDEVQSFASSVVKRLGITDVKVITRPGEELLTIEDIKERPSVFIGNGLTDVPVLVAADVGVAVGARGSTAAGDAADVVILQNDLGLIAKAMATAKQAVRNIHLALAMAIGLSLLLMLVLATGKVAPLIGVLIRAAIEIAVIFSVLWTRRFSSV